jgi:hypothetical protein
MDKRFEDLLVQYVQESGGAGRRQLEEALWAEFGAEPLDLSISSLSLEALTIKH